MSYMHPFAMSALLGVCLCAAICADGETATNANDIGTGGAISLGGYGGGSGHGVTGGHSATGGNAGSGGGSGAGSSSGSGSGSGAGGAAGPQPGDCFFLADTPSCTACMVTDCVVSCADQGAQKLKQTNAINADDCAASYVSACPRWPGSPKSMVDDCIRKAWHDGAKAKQYMSGASLSEVACGFFVAADGGVYATQYFR